MDFDRREALEQIKINLGFVERKDDEFTIKEMAKCFKTSPSNIIQYLDLNEVKYERRKALANNRRQYVYRVIIEK